MATYRCNTCGLIFEWSGPQTQKPECPDCGGRGNIFSSELDSKPDWITLDKSSGTGGSSVKVTAAGNTGTSSRNGYLTVRTASGITKTVRVLQEARAPINIIVGGANGYLTKLTI